MELEFEMDYCLRREGEERAAGARATCVAVRDVHRVMAERYADRACLLFEKKFKMENGATNDSGMTVRVNDQIVMPVSRASR